MPIRIPTTVTTLTTTLLGTSSILLPRIITPAAALSTVSTAATTLFSPLTPRLTPNTTATCPRIHHQIMTFSSTSNLGTEATSPASTSTVPGHAPSVQDAAEEATTTTTTNVEATADGEQTTNPDAPRALPALPAPPPPGEDTDSGNGMRTVMVNGQAVALDNLGPMVVGRDGTVSRIANWPEMTEIERANTLRILCKRNQLRLANLRAGRPADYKGEENNYGEVQGKKEEVKQE
ncbi:uncharacterized protein CTHT_0007020 [Thermochaetoides thermophila DSM 1495]|uniref:Uncharacterized protein n=1 Tax=Chaetomium thermophilum (strain DSM 1495 / CBS 144.50 / IMI 039719) TaxID=759272 RepID=G0RYK5_CHATD|nr:hypothetical protein CTHT_0007020 [Thermochaetoides thermophila DSM 1495]EGS23991.1 hypothetical protein CTHT_0007020 [Thermochaetoides thermophila DSM 1495]